MSHTVTMRTLMTEIPPLRAAVHRLGGTFHENANRRFVGHEARVCAHIAEFPRCRFSLGVAEDATLYMDSDAYDLQKILGPNNSKLVQAYGVELAKLQLAQEGHCVSVEQVLENGDVLLTVEA